jgi:hypothetical protein
MRKWIHFFSHGKRREKGTVIACRPCAVCEQGRGKKKEDLSLHRDVKG